MTETKIRKCRICSASDDEGTISDASCYTEFFIQILSIKNMDENILLCIWCTAALKKAMIFINMALESEKNIDDEVTSEVSSKHKSLYNLRIVHNSHIDIPPFVNQSNDTTDELDQSTSLIELQNNIQLNENEQLTEIKSEDFNIEEEPLIKRERKNKKEFEFNELDFEVEYLNLEEQLKDVELKKLKYKDFEFQCDFCGMGFLTGDVFDEHRIRHSELSGPNKCSICALRFKSQDVLSQHILAHKRRFKCLLCDSVFKRWSHCIAHRHKCGGIVQPSACEECSKIFSNEFSLKIHMKVHNNEKKYYCDQCDRKFASKQRLTVHMRSHSGLKPFACNQCSRTFTTKSNLRAHSSVHEHTSRYYCVECHTYYKTDKSLKRHFKESIKHVALGNDMYSCKVCTKKFSNEKSLDCHINTRHGTEHRCTHCDKTFSNNSNLNKHMKCIHAIK